MLTGCVVNTDFGGPVQHFEKSIDLDKSEMARVEIKMGAGELKVQGGSPKLMDSNFDYNVVSSKPIVHYNASSFRGEVLIEQPSGFHGGTNSTYKWDVRLNDKVPIDFVTHLGAGEAHLNLGAMNLRSVEIHMGVGQVELDLRGNPTRDYNVEIHGGIGQAVVHVPSSVGIIANASGGIGDIEVHGLEKHNGHWTNSAYEHSPVTIHLDVKGGIGNITLTAE
jgi:predicted membrane protein